MDYIVRAYIWLISHEACPCRVGLSALCGRLDDYLWRHDLW